MESVLDSSPERIVPPCTHFGRCGGCSLQHWRTDASAQWKRRRVVASLAQRGLNHVSVEPSVTIPPGSRRRATFAFSGHALGFNARGSDRVEDLGECPLLAPAIVALLPALRDLLPNLAERGDVHVTLSETGLDVWIDLPSLPGLDTLERLAAFAQDRDLARIGWRSGDIATPAAERRTPILTIGNAAVALPPRAFLQPSPEGEAALAEHALAAVGEATPAIDLFCGIGTFALRLAARGPVLAVDGDAALTAALDATRRVTVVTRDLFHRPLQPSEMKGYRAGLFDPPRAGGARTGGDTGRIRSRNDCRGVMQPDDLRPRRSDSRRRRLSIGMGDAHRPVSLVGARGTGGAVQPSVVHRLSTKPGRPTWRWRRSRSARRIPWTASTLSSSTRLTMM